MNETPPIIRVPDLEPPTRTLCWQEEPRTGWRCDRASGHDGWHSWELLAALRALEAEMRQDADGDHADADWQVAHGQEDAKSRIQRDARAMTTRAWADKLAALLKEHDA